MRWCWITTRDPSVLRSRRCAAHHLILLGEAHPPTTDHRNPRMKLSISSNGKLNVRKRHCLMREGSATYLWLLSLSTPQRLYFRWERYFFDTSLPPDHCYDQYGRRFIGVNVHARIERICSGDVRQQDSIAGNPHTQIRGRRGEIIHTILYA